MSKLRIGLAIMKKEKIISIGNWHFPSNEADVLCMASAFPTWLFVGIRIGRSTSQRFASQLRWIIRPNIEKKGTQFHSVCDLFVCMRVDDVCGPIDSCDILHTYPELSQGKQYKKLSDGTSFFPVRPFRKYEFFPPWTASQQTTLQPFVNDEVGYL